MAFLSDLDWFIQDYQRMKAKLHKQNTEIEIEADGESHTEASDQQIKSRVKWSAEVDEKLTEFYKADLPYKYILGLMAYNFPMYEWTHARIANRICSIGLSAKSKK